MGTRRAAIQSSPVRRSRWVRWSTGLMAAALLAWVAWMNRPEPETSRFPLNYVRIEGSLRHLDVEKLRESLLPALRAGYFSLDMGELENAVRAFAWVDRAKVTRVWPDTLVVSVIEQNPIVRWGDKALLNERGERFEPPDVKGFGMLPVIFGPAGMEGALLRVLNGLNKQLENKHMRVAMLELSKRRAYSVRLDPELDIHFGRQEPLQALDRFLTLAPRLGEGKLPLLQRVDLRYPNGFTVVWKPAPESPDSQPSPMGAAFHPTADAGTAARETF
jgi:cell division protein FtsQ